MITDVEDGVDFAMNRMECYRTHQLKTAPRECGDDPYGVALVEVFEVEDRPTPTLLPDPDHDHGATTGAQGGIMGDVYNSVNNDMPITIAKRYGRPFRYLPLGVYNCR